MGDEVRLDAPEPQGTWYLAALSPWFPWVYDEHIQVTDEHLAFAREPRGTVTDWVVGGPDPICELRVQLHGFRPDVWQDLTLLHVRSGLFLSGDGWTREQRILRVPLHRGLRLKDTDGRVLVPSVRDAGKEVRFRVTSSSYSEKLVQTDMTSDGATDGASLAPLYFISTENHDTLFAIMYSGALEEEVFNGQPAPVSDDGMRRLFHLCEDQDEWTGFHSTMTLLGELNVRG